MGGGDLVVIQDRQGITRHVAEPIGIGGEVAAVGLAGVPVIEPDDLPPPADQYLH
jgi:hypothetical protein